MNLNWREPSYYGRVVYAGTGLVLLGIVEVLLFPDIVWGLGGIVAGVISVVGAFALDRFRSGES